MNNYLYSESDFIHAINQSYLNYKSHGARSTRKLEPLHNYVANVLRSIWGSDYFISSMEIDNKEKIVEGKYYPKRIDITISKNHKPIFCVGIKFITGNYKQNSNNYFQNMMGETANIQAIPELKYAHMIIIRRYTPYYKKNDNSIPSKIEEITQKDLMKYLKLMFDNNHPHKPYLLCIFPIDIDEASNTVSAVSYEYLLEKNSDRIENYNQSSLFYDTFSPERFFSRIANLKKYIDSIR